MGQRVQAVVYGVFLTAKQVADLDKVYADGAWRDSLPMGIETGDGDKEVLGIRVAASNCCEEDEVDFPECKVADLEKSLKARLSAAKKEWKDLVARWAKSRALKLDKPELLIIKAERA